MKLVHRTLTRVLHRPKIQAESQLLVQGHNDIAGQIPFTTFFDDDNFGPNKDNMHAAVAVLETLDLPQRLHLTAHLASELTRGKPVYRDSKAVKWLLSDHSVSGLVLEALRECESLEMKQLSEIMFLCQHRQDDAAVRRVTARMRQLIPFVQGPADLEWVIRTIRSVQATPCRKWTAVERIVELQELTLLEHATRASRNANQHVEIFSLIKDFDLSTLSQVEVDIVHRVIEQIQSVDPALYLKLTLDLVSHFLFECSAKRIDDKPVQQVLGVVPLERLKREIPTLELFERLSSAQYDPSRFTADQLARTTPLWRPLTSLACVSFYDLFPGLAENLALISDLNLHRNLARDDVLEQVFNSPRVRRAGESSHAELVVLQMSRQLVRVMRGEPGPSPDSDSGYASDRPLVPCQQSICESLIRFKNDVDMRTKTFRTSVGQLLVQGEYSSLLELTVFFESCFRYSFPLFYYCAQNHRAAPENALFESFGGFSLELLVYLCKMGRALVKKVREFDLSQSVLFIETRFADDPEKLHEMLLQVAHFDRQNRVVLGMVQDTLGPKLRHMREIDHDCQTRMLLENMQKLWDLLG